MSYRLSIVERIALTTGFRTSSDSRVLAALASFAHFETGCNAHPNIDHLRARVPDLTKRTVERCLVRLEADGWIEGRHQHRRPTNYRICLERLATSATMAKVVDAPSLLNRQSVGQREEILTDTLSRLTDSLSGLTDKVSDHPDLYPDLYPSAPALSAPASPDAPTATAATTRTGGESVPLECAAPDADLRADGRDHSHAAGGRATGPRGDQAPAPGARVHLPERSDPSGPARDHPPQQQTLGPLDVSPTPATRLANVAKLADVWRTALAEAKRKSG